MSRWSRFALWLFGTAACLLTLQAAGTAVVAGEGFPPPLSRSRQRMKPGSVDVAGSWNRGYPPGRGPAALGRGPAALGRGPAALGRGPAALGRGPAALGRSAADSSVLAVQLLSRRIDTSAIDTSPGDVIHQPLAQNATIRGQNPAEEAAIVPLISWDRTPAVMQPVAGSALLNPLALLGNPRQWHGRFRAAFGSNFDEREMIYGNYQLTSGAPLGLDTEFIYRQDEQRRLADRRFWNGDANVVYHLRQIRWLVFRMGVGVNWLTDGENTDVGFNTTYGFDIRLKKPWYISTSIDWGQLDSDEMLHWHISGGMEFGWLELFIGYDFFEVGSLERKTVLAGAGIWF